MAPKLPRSTISVRQILPTPKPSATSRISYTTPTPQNRSDASTSILNIARSSAGTGTGTGTGTTGTGTGRPLPSSYSFTGQIGTGRSFELQRAERAQRVDQERDAMRQKAQSLRANIEFSRQMPRKWIIGDVYAPHDLSADEMRKNKKSVREPDLVDMFQWHPLDMYKNFSFLSYYMTPGGSIQHPNVSMLRPVNQRKIAKAIRRAIGMGLQPSVHRHPEILKDEFLRQSNWWSYTVMRKGNIWQ